MIGYPGIQQTGAGKYRAFFYAESQRAYLGTFPTLEEAVEARDKAKEVYRRARPFRRLRKDNKSGHPGVHYDSAHKNWRARKNGVELGTYANRRDAISAVIDFEIKQGT